MSKFDCFCILYIIILLLVGFDDEHPVPAAKTSQLSSDTVTVAQALVDSKHRRNQPVILLPHLLGY